MEFAGDRGGGDMAAGSAGPWLSARPEEALALRPPESLQRVSACCPKLEVLCSVSPISTADLLLLPFCCPCSSIARSPSVILRLYMFCEGKGGNLLL